jgi:hypothetical protein
MPVTADKPAPYTSPSAVIDIIQRHRSKGLPQPVNSEVLSRGGISESLIPRTLQTLQSLDLIDDQGKITQVFEGIRLAPEAEYQKRMAEWLNSAYADVLQYIDPATASEVEVRDAFRSYSPTGQQSRMVTLFIGLYAAAGIGAPKQAGKASSVPRSSTTPQRRKTFVKPAVKKTTDHGSVSFTSSSSFPPALEGLLKSLPTNGQGWTQEQRDKFFETFGAVLDFCIPIGVRNPPINEEETEEDQE